MDATQRKDALSADDLKSHLYQSLHSSGLLKQLKGQLRRSMINELKGKGEKKFQSSIQSKHSDLVSATIKQQKSRSWIHQAIDNLVYLHLKQNGYQYSLSLFEQESCVESYMPSLMDDFLQRLGLNLSDLDITVDTPTSSLSEEFLHLTSTPTQRKDPGIALWIILEKLSLLAASKPLGQVEKVKLLTEEDKPLSLGEKLKAVDEEMQMRVYHQPRDPAIAISSYTSAVRKAEEDAERRAKAHFEQWKSIELVQFKMEESQKSKTFVDTRLKELEDDYQSKRDALQNRERAAVSRLQQQREMLEREMHEQRQSLLLEIEQIRIREEALHKQEQVMHDMELVKRDELNLLHERMDQAKQSKAASKEPATDQHIPQHSQATETELKKMHHELQYKSSEMEQLKKELSQLKTELTSARRFNQCQADRENLILRSHLEQLTREIYGPKTTPKEVETASGEAKLRQEIEKLKIERTEQEAQQRHLAHTLNEMKQALEDSNSALSRRNTAKEDTPATSQQKGLPTVSDVISSYTPPTKRVNFREYEPVQTSLHPALVSSGEFDDPSMDEQVASANVRVDLLQRMKELEDQTYEVDEHYQRYLRTHYRNLEQQLNKQSMRPQTSSFRSSPSPKTRSSLRPRQTSQKERLGSMQKDLEVLLSPPVQQPPHSTKDEMPVHLTDSGSLVSFEEPVKDDSSLEILKPPTIPAASIQTSMHRSAEEKDRSKVGMEPKLPDRSASTDLKLFMDSLEQNAEEEVTSSSKSSSDPSRSPQMETARLADATPQSESKAELLHPHTLPPIAGPRKLPSLTPPKTNNSPPLKDAESPQTPSRLSSEEKANYSIEKSNRAYFGESSFPPIQPHSSSYQADNQNLGASHLSDRKTPNESQSDDNSDSESEDVPEPPKRTSIDEYPSHPQILPLNRVRQVSDRSETSQSPSAISEMSLPSFSSSNDNNPLLNLEKPVAEIEKPVSTIESESVSGRVNPIAKSGRTSSSSDETSEVEDGIEEQLIKDKMKPKKTWDDFDLSNEEDISEALRFSDAVKPALDFDDDDEEEEMVAEAKQIPVVVEDPEIEEEVPEVEEEIRIEVDVFEMSDHPISLDSIESEKQDLNEVKSDVSW